MLNVSDDRITRMLLVERADVLRLLYIYDKGGLYTDLDNDIDYPCLYELISTKNESFFSQEQGQPLLPSNNMIYAPKPHDPKIERVIKLIQECPSCEELNFASPYFLRRITVDFVNVKKCVNHLFHSSWFWWGDLEGQNISPASAKAYAKCVKYLKNCK
jgi:mannosyltransferase OCH1-like enzyme